MGHNLTPKADSIGEFTRAQKGCTAHLPGSLFLVAALDRDYIARQEEGKTHAEVVELALESKNPSLCMKSPPPPLV